MGDIWSSNTIDENKEGLSCDWESLIADDSNLLIFESPNDTENKKLFGTEMSIYATIRNDKQNMQSLVAMYSGEQIGEGCQPENLSFNPGEGTEMMENSEKHDMTVSSLNDPMEEMDYENFSGLYQGMRRRCLVFEMGGAHRQRFEEISAPESSVVLQSGSDTSTNNRQRVPTDTIDESPQCVVPTLGLHLNAQGTTPKDYKLVNLEPSASGRLLIGPSPSVDFHPPTTGQELLNNLDVTLLGGVIDLFRSQKFLAKPLYMWLMTRSLRVVQRRRGVGWNKPGKVNPASDATARNQNA